MRVVSLTQALLYLLGWGIMFGAVIVIGIATLTATWVMIALFGGVGKGKKTQGWYVS